MMLGEIKVVDDRALVDAQHSPGIVSMHGVGVLLHGRVQHLLDTRNIGVPCLERLDHVSNVQAVSVSRVESQYMDTKPEQHDSRPEPSATVRFDTRVAVLLRSDLLPWQGLNVTAFLMSGIVTSAQQLTGAPYLDADGNEYLPMLRQPVLVFSAELETLATARAKALERGMAVAIYTRDLFSTTHDEANRAAVETVPATALDLVGVAIRGPRNAVDRITKRASKHP